MDGGASSGVSGRTHAAGARRPLLRGHDRGPGVTSRRAADRTGPSSEVSAVMTSPRSLYEEGEQATVTLSPEYGT